MNLDVEFGDEHLLDVLVDLSIFDVLLLHWVCEA